jgi:hypothetical protein
LVLGLLADLPRKNCWTLAEHATCAPEVVEHLGDPEAVPALATKMITRAVGDGVPRRGWLKLEARLVGSQATRPPTWANMVGRDGIEPPTLRFSAARSTD